MNDRKLYIGAPYPTGGDNLIGLDEADLAFHCHLIGSTGSGKTSLLRNLIVQHILLGNGVAVIDPHGDLATDLLRQVPPQRADDLIYFDPADVHFPIGLNPVGKVENISLAASGIVEALHNLWTDSWGPRMEYILLQAVTALLHADNTSLLGLNRMLVDKHYRRWVIGQVRDPFVVNFWEEEFESWDPRFRREAIAPIQNKAGRFLLNPTLRNILGQVANKISFPAVMDRGQLFIANLSRGRIGQDNADLLGSLLVSQFQLAAMARAHVPESERRPFYLFIDEFQNFTTEAFAAMLSEARKYRLSLTISHQYTGQLSESVRQSVFANVGSMIAFRLGWEDAECLAGELGHTWIGQQFVDLPRFQALVKTRDNGELWHCRLKTLPPMDYGKGRPEQLIQRCRERFSTPSSVIEQRLRRWIGKEKMGVSDSTSIE